MTTLTVSADSQAIALACSSIAHSPDQALKPLSATEWHDLSVAMQASRLRPRDLLGMSVAELREAVRTEPEMAERLAELLSYGGQLAFEIERLSSRGIWLMTRADDSYPATLKKRLRGKAPPVLFGAGASANLQLPAIAVVGSREIDEERLHFAGSFARQCVAQGFAVVSGAARGVDLAAMQGAIESGGPAVGVTVDPLERLVRRRDMRSAIADDLLTLATPFHPSARWHAGNAMRRNRLIYALARAAVVVASAAEKGGTRSGALENLAAGWVPLHVRDDGTPGNRQLIAEGAIPLASGRPVAEIEIEALLRRPQPSLVDQRESAHRGHVVAVRPLDSPSSDDPFDAAWPILERHLREPLSERELADRAHLEPMQARAWLKRAVAEGRAEVTQRPTRYRVRTVPAAQLRIDGA